MGKTVTVTQTGSTIGSTKKQSANISGLGLRGIGSSKILEDTPSIRGMIKVVKHLVRVEEK